MRLMKFFSVFFVMLFLLASLAYAAIPEPLTFKWLPAAPAMNGDHASAEGGETASVDSLTIYRGYRDHKLYLYFSIVDMTQANQDGFTLRFDTNGDGTPTDAEPYILLYRNGAVDNPNGFEYALDISPARSWSGEILVPFSLIGLSTDLPLQGKGINGPNMWFKAYDSNIGSVGVWRGATTVGSTTSAYKWSQPMPYPVVTFPESNPDVTWVRETDNPKVMVLNFWPETNHEERISITSFTLSSSGIGNELEHVKSVEADLYNEGKTTHLPSQVFTSDNGQVTFPVDISLWAMSQAENAPGITVYYVMDSDAGYVDTGNGKSPGTFTVKLESLAATGEYTGEPLSATGVPAFGATLTATDCKTNAGCADDEICAFGSCRDVVATSDCGYAANHVWNIYACCADADCGAGKVCTNHVCGAAPLVLCTGTVDLGVTNVGGEITASVTGIGQGCDNKLVYVRYGSCSGTTKCSFLWKSGAANACVFPTPSDVGVHNYYACADMNGDAAYAAGELDYSTITITAVGVVEIPAAPVQPSTPVAPATGQCGSCSVSKWASCTCPTGSSYGTQVGRCADSCGNTSVKEQECKCASSAVPSPSSQQPSSGQLPTILPTNAQPANVPVVPSFTSTADYAVVGLILVVCLALGYIVSRKLEIKKK